MAVSTVTAVSEQDVEKAEDKASELLGNLGLSSTCYPDDGNNILTVAAQADNGLAVSYTVPICGISDTLLAKGLKKAVNGIDFEAEFEARFLPRRENADWIVDNLREDIAQFQLATEEALEANKIPDDIASTPVLSMTLDDIDIEQILMQADLPPTAHNVAALVQNFAGRGGANLKYYAIEQAANILKQDLKDGRYKAYGLTK